MPVVLLVHCDGTNGSTTFTDVSPSARTLTAGSTCTVSTTSPKFGTGSATFSTNVDNRITVGAPQTDFNFGAGQFTVEAWGNATVTPNGTPQAVVAQFGGSSNLGWFLGLNGGSLLFFYSTTGTDTLSVGGTFAPTLNQWYHLAADRDASNVLRVYVDGVVKASATVSATLFASTQSTLIGNDNNLNRFWPGRLDEVRVTKGTAQYGGAFTPPTQAFGTATTRNPIAYVVS